MTNRHGQHIADIGAVEELVLVMLDTDVGIDLTDEMLARVAAQSAGQQVGFAENLETVANADDGFAQGGEFGDRIHDGRETGDGAGAQVVAVGEAARQNERIERRKVRLFMPDARLGMTEHLLDDVRTVAVAVGAGENDDSEMHGDRVRTTILRSVVSNAVLALWEGENPGHEIALGA